MPPSEFMKVPACVARSKRSLGFYVARQTRCQICGATRGLVVDHKHDETQIVRGVLCHTCNVGVGFIERAKDRGTFDRMLRYIETDGEESLERARIDAIIREIRDRRAAREQAV